MSRGTVPGLVFLCGCIMTGCVTFQTGPSRTLPEGERVVIDGRGQVRVIDQNPAGKEAVLLVHV